MKWAISILVLVSSFAFAEDLTTDQVTALRAELVATLLDSGESRQIGTCTVSYDSGNYQVANANGDWMRLLLVKEGRVNSRFVDVNRGEMQLIGTEGSKRIVGVLTAKPVTSPVFTEISVRSEKQVDVNVGTATNPKIIKQWKSDLVFNCK